MEYILLKNQLQDKTIYEKLIQLLTDRIRHLIEDDLGLHGISYDELKIKRTEFKDRYATTFAKIEDLEKDRKIATTQYNLICDFLNEVDRMMLTMNDREREIFRLKYIYGLTNKQIEDRGIACEKTIRNYLKEIDKK